MALLTFSGSVSKGQAKSMLLSKSSILNMASVSGDAYWSDAANISKAIVVYGADGGQEKFLTFDFAQSSPAADLLISDKGRNAWEIKRLILMDFDGGELVVEAATLQAQVSGGIAGLALSLGGGGGVSFSGSARTYSFKSSIGNLAVLGAAATTDTVSYSIASGLMDFSFELSQTPTTGNIEPYGGGYLGIALPAGYSFGDLSSFPTVSTNAGTYRKLGTVTWVNAGGTYILDACADTATGMIALSYAPSQVFILASSGNLLQSTLQVSMSLTGIPVV